MKQLWKGYEMKMNTKQEGEELLGVHAVLGGQLLRVPYDREITYREEIKDGVRIGKPRFACPKYQWPVELLKQTHDHLQNIWRFFEIHSHWFDESIRPLIARKERRVSKRSILFLLENDIWSTDEIFGDYLIEEGEEFAISYYRREQKVRQFRLPKMDNSELEAWICRDAIEQIRAQFQFLWEKLKREVAVCMEEKYLKPTKRTVTENYLHQQLDKTIEIVMDWPEAALLSLGRLIEQWLLIALGKTARPYQSDIIRDAELEGVISRGEMRVLSKIWTHYNNIKHKTHYTADAKEIGAFVEAFSTIITSI
jgi:hypothetical protein